MAVTELFGVPAHTEVMLLASVNEATVPETKQGSSQHVENGEAYLIKYKEWNCDNEMCPTMEHMLVCWHILHILEVFKQAFSHNIVKGIHVSRMTWLFRWHSRIEIAFALG